jgi:hypothetical protein
MTEIYDPALGSKLIRIDGGAKLKPRRPLTNGRHDDVLTSEAAGLEMQGVDWFWPGRFSLGKITLIAGLPDYGKGQIAAFLAAVATAAIELPCNEGTAPQGNVIWCNAEDDPRDTVLPRLVAAGADPKRIHCKWRASRWRPAGF